MESGNSPLEDEPYFELVGREMASGELRPGLWTQCLTVALFDEKLAKALYVKQRVKEFKQKEADETAVQQNLLALEEAKTALAEAKATAHEAELRFNQLIQRQAKLAPAENRRTIVFVFGICGGMAIGLVSCILTDRLFPLFAGGLIGSFVAWLSLMCMPSQHQADEEAVRIQTELKAVGARYQAAQDAVKKLS